MLTKLLKIIFISTRHRLSFWATRFQRSFIGWKLQSGFGSSWPFSHIDASAERHPLICPMNSSGSRDQNPPTIGSDHTAAGPPYTAVDCRRPSFSCRRCPHLERPAAPRPHHLCLFSENAPLPAFFSVTVVQCLRSDSCYCWHSNRSFYLLTYLLTGRTGSGKEVVIGASNAPRGRPRRSWLTWRWLASSACDRLGSAVVSAAAGETLRHRGWREDGCGFQATENVPTGQLLITSFSLSK